MIKKFILLLFCIGCVAFVVMRHLETATINSPSTQTAPDTSVKNDAHRQISQPTFEPDDTARLQGIDISHYQGVIDWERVARAGIRFAFSKASQGLTGVDARYDSNRSAASAKGLPFGAYHFFEPNDDPIEQAKHFLSIAKVGTGSLPPVVDVETAATELDRAAFSEAIEKWIQYVHKETGCQPLIYASPSFFNTHFDDTLTNTPYWLAEYSSEPHPPSKDLNWTFWQHSQKGAVDGVSGHVDLDWFAGDEAGLKSILCS